MSEKTGAGLGPGWARFVHRAEQREKREAEEEHIRQLQMDVQQRKREKAETEAQRRRDVQIRELQEELDECERGQRCTKRALGLLKSGVKTVQEYGPTAAKIAGAAATAYKFAAPFLGGAADGFYYARRRSPDSRRRAPHLMDPYRRRRAQHMMDVSHAYRGRAPVWHRSRFVPSRHRLRYDGSRRAHRSRARRRTSYGRF
jgi:hypothetical protein